MKTSLILFLSIALLFGCKSGTNNNTDSIGMGMEDGTGENFNNTETWDQEEIREFADKAALGGMMEVELGKIAQKNGMSQQVRDFGKTMETEHGNANTQLKAALQSLSLNVPATMDKDHQDKVDNLNKKAGNEFDKEYIDEMVSDHKDDIDEFEKALQNLPTGELRTWVENTLPVLRQHHVQAQTIQDQLKNN